jgi:hypothetical protein
MIGLNVAISLHCDVDVLISNFLSIKMVESAASWQQLFKDTQPYNK